MNLTVFNWNVMIVFGVTIALYLIGLVIFVIVKNVVHKKRFNKERKEHEEQENIKNKVE